MGRDRPLASPVVRAWLLDDTKGPSSYRLGETPAPEPNRAEVRVHLNVSALNHLDLWVSLGLPKPPRFPHVAGADGAGVVESVGEGVIGWRPGDEAIIDPSISCGTCAACLAGNTVYCPSYSILGEHLPGTLAEYVVVPTRNLLRKAAALSWEVAGSFALVTGTAYRMLRRARLRPQEVILVVGVGGGVSSAAMLMGRAWGARVYVTSRSSEKIEWALAHGAEGGFSSAGEFSKDLRGAIGRGADVVVENVGPATWSQSLRSLEPGGRLVVCGGTSGAKVELNLPALFFRHAEVIGSSMYTPAELARASHLVATGSVPVPVDSVYPFEKLPEALARLESAEQLGKVVLRH